MLTFSPTTHEYRYNGTPVPSVTQVIDFLCSFGFVSKDVLDRASAFGQAVHRATELFDLDDLVEESLDPALVPYLNGWRRFLTDTGFEVHAVEEQVYSRRYRYAGTLDRYGLLQGHPAVIDIKTCTTLHPSIGLQTAAYAQAYREHCDAPAAQRFAVQLKPDSYKLQPYTESTDLSVFLSALQLRNWRNNHG